MMSEVIHQEDAVESAFEIVNASGGSSHRQTPDTPSMPSGETLPSTIVANQSVPPAPSALPSFAQMPPAGVPPVPASGSSIPPPPSSSASPGTNPFSVRAAGGQSLNTVVHSSPHVATPPSPAYGGSSPPAAATFFPPPVPQPQNVQQHRSSFPQPEASLDIPFEVMSGQPCDPMTSQDRRASTGVLNWFTKTISQSEFLTKVAEKAKTSVDSMITTLDPQMKDYMNPTGTLELYVVCTEVDLISNVKAGFSRYFPNLIVRGVPPAFTPNVALQPVGYECGMNAVKEAVKSVQNSGLVTPNSLILAFNSFLVNSYAENWLEFYCVALSNGLNIDLQTFTQPVTVPSFVLDILKNQTAADYPLASSGFACSVDQVMSHSHGMTIGSWHQQYSGLSKAELIGFACATLAYLYRATSTNMTVNS